MAPLEAQTIVSEHPDKVRMLVLETDEPHPEIQKEKGSFGEVLHDLLHHAGKEHDPELGIETMMQYVVEPDGGKIPKAEEITDDIHAILITGSVYDAHSDESWILKLIGLIECNDFRQRFMRRANYPRSLDPSSGHQIYGYLLRSPDTLSYVRIKSETKRQR